MARWTIDSPQRLTPDEPVTSLKVDMVAGRLNVVGTDGPARVDVTRITSGFPEVRDRAGLGGMRESEGVIGTGAGKLWASATSGSIALLARPVDDEKEELP